MPLAVVAVVGGLVLLWKAADQFVIGAARLAATLRVSPVVIGAVIVGFGTSAPEMVVSAIGAAQGELDVAAGNVIGSNVANLTLVLGVAALVVPLAISSRALRREAPLSTAAVLVFALFVQGGLSRVEASLLFVLLVLVLGYIINSARGGEDQELIGEVDEYLEEGDSHRVGLELPRTLAGLGTVVLGAWLTIEGALTIAEELALEAGFIGLTLVALGTSLPELVTSIAAAKKGEDELIIGNLLGSNIFNSLAVGAAAGLAGPGPLEDPELAGLATVVMVAVAVVTWLFMATGRAVVRWEAMVLLGAYCVTVPLLAV